MQKCQFCGAEMPDNARFCGTCGRVQDANSAPESATIRSSTAYPSWYSDNSAMPETQAPPPPPPSNPGWPTPSGQQWTPNSQYPNTNPSQDNQQAGTYPAYMPYPGTPAPGGQTYAPMPPTVQGTPQPDYMATVASSPSVPGTAPQTYPYTTAAKAGETASKTGFASKTLIIALIIIVVVVGGGIATAVYFLTRPQPVITANSQYKVGSTLAGAAGTTLHISGQKFSGNSAITFLLDGNPAPGSPAVTSDSNGTFSANLPITSAWSLGQHTLTARDAGNYTTKDGISFMIVSPGEANTPGPFGAPPDSASFKVSGTANANNVGTSGSFTLNETMIITGHPDPQGGTVCQAGDNGQPIVYNGFTSDTHTAFRETYSYSCQGTYKGGKFTYQETLTSDTIVYTSVTPQVSCSLTSPQVNQKITASYNSQHQFTGTVVFPEIARNNYSCTATGAYFFHYGAQGTFTGTLA